MSVHVKESCGDCRYSVSDPANIGAVMCRRRAPVAVPINTPQGLGTMSIFPSMKADGWCGEFTAKSTN